MDIKSLEACFQNATKISQTVEEYEVLSEISSMLKCNSGYKDEDTNKNLLTDDFLKTIDYLSKDNGLYFTTNVTLDWFVFYLFSRRYPSRDRNTSVATMNFNKPWRHVINDDDAKFAVRLNVPVDNLISWLWNRPFVKQNLRMYSSAIRLSQSYPVARRHMVSHAIRWTIYHLKNSDLDFTTGSPLTIPRGGSFDGLSEGGDLEPISDKSVDDKGDPTESTAMWFATVIESNGALTEQRSGKKPVQILRLAIEELILTCITDPQEEIRNMVFKRLQTFFQKAPLPISAVFCLRWTEISHQTAGTNWIQQEGLLKLINTFVDVVRDKSEESVQEEISGSQLLKQRLSIVFTSALNKRSNDNFPPSFNGKTTNPEDERIKKVLLPKVRNLTLGLIASHRIPVRQLAVTIYINCVSLMHPENQAKILENAAITLEQDISIRLDEIANNVPSNRPKLSQYLVESLTIICSKVAEMPNRSHCSVDWLQIASCCETMLSHPSQRVRDASADLLVAIFKIYKNSVQMARAVMVVVTQAWTSRQEVLFKPFNQLPKMPEFDPEHEDKAKDCRTAWRSGHLIAFIKINQMLLEEYRRNYNNPLKQRKSLLSPLFDSNVARKFSFSANKAIFRNRSSDVNQEAPLLLRLKQMETTELKQVIWNVCSASSSKNSRPRSLNSSEQGFPLNGSDTASVISSYGYSSINSMNINSPVSNNCCFRTCLTIVLHAAVECTCDSDRLIRHQAVQTLSEVTQVIGLFDHTLLANIIMTHMSFEPTLLTYGCLEILLNILVSLKNGKIGNININLTDDKQTSQLSPSLLNGLLSIDRSRVWLRTCSHYINSRETFDAVTLNAVQVVMCALTSVHQLGPLSVRLSQARMDSLTEGDEELADQQSEDGDQDFENNSKSSLTPGGDNQLDMDIESLISAVDSLKDIIQRLLSLHSSRHKEQDCFGWIPESPTRRRKSANGVIYTATNDEIYLEFIYLLLRRIEIPLQVYLCCNSRQSLSHVPSHLQPVNVETVAVALSKLVDPLASLGFEMYMTQFISRRQESIGGFTTPVYIEALREKCMISIINLIGLITQSLPKNPVLGVDTKNDFKDPRSQSQDTVNRLESYVNSSAHVKETCDKFTNILHDIMNFARRNLYPKSFLKCAHWWWIGHMCSSLPNLCQATPGQVDTSRLVELLCNEISTLRTSTLSPKNSDRDPAMVGPQDRPNQYSTLQSMSRSPPVPSSSSSTASLRDRNPAQLNWMRVKQVSMAVAAFQSAARRPHQNEQLSVEVERENNGEMHSEAESSDEKSDHESDSESISSGYDSKALRSKSRSGSESSDASLLKKQDFLPLSIDETSILVAKLIKCSDARTIEPLQNIIPKDVVSRVRKMLQEEQRT